MPLFDIVIPVGPNEAGVIKLQLEYTKKNIIGYRNIYVVTTPVLYESLKTLTGCTLICEDIYPFTIDMMNTFAHAPRSDRNGWYLQQLIKLYAGVILPGILERWLVIDCDTFFLKPTTFVKNDKCLYAFGIEFWFAYFRHMNRMLPGLGRVDEELSGICHHMIFEKKYVDELFNKVEALHKKPFWQVFLGCIEPDTFDIPNASEYEIYFNYMLTYNKDKITLRKLNWDNTNTLELHSAYDYIAWHHYNRK